MLLVTRRCSQSSESTTSTVTGLSLTYQITPSRFKHMTVVECSSNLNLFRTLWVYQVYQGTALGPIMFSIFSNDLAMHVPDAGLVQYADDVQIWKTGKKQCIDELLSSMESTLSKVSDWFSSNSMKVNTAKTQLIVFGTRNTLRDLPPVQLKFGTSIITESREVKNLGLTMDRHLTFRKPYQSTCGQVYRCFDRPITLKACAAFIHSCIGHQCPCGQCDTVLYYHIWDMQQDSAPPHSETAKFLRKGDQRPSQI